MPSITKISTVYQDKAMSVRTRSYLRPRSVKERVQQRHIQSVKKATTTQVRRRAIGVRRRIVGTVAGPRKVVYGSPEQKKLEEKRAALMQRRRLNIESPLTKLRILPDWLAKYTDLEIFDVPMMVPQGGWTKANRDAVLARKHEVDDRMMNLLMRDPLVEQAPFGPLHLNVKPSLSRVYGHQFYGKLLPYREVKAAYAWIVTARQVTKDFVSQVRHYLGELNRKELLILVHLRWLKDKYVVKYFVLQDDEAASDLVKNISRAGDEALDKIGHRNILIFNNKFKTVERFEPHGMTNAWSNTPFQDQHGQLFKPDTPENTMIDDAIQEFLGRALPEFTYVPSRSICPRWAGPQEDLPLCITYGYMYFHLRITNPHLNPMHITDWMSKAGRFGFERWDDMSSEEKNEARGKYILAYLNWALHALEASGGIPHREAIRMVKTAPVVRVAKAGYTRPRGF
jgi:uncharacterized protein YigA (DUF484 family)